MVKLGWVKTTMKNKKEAMVTVPASTLIVVTENHGGYLGTQCLICGACGWQNKWQHEKNCIVGQAIANFNLTELRETAKEPTQ
jgi:hypothetical protein